MKLFLLASLSGAGLILVAAFAPSSLLDKQAAILKDAKTLKISYTLRVAGVATDYTLTYSKPDLMTLESANSLVESNGKTLWEYNKVAKTYTESPVTPELISAKAQSDEVLAWASFFTDDFVKRVSDAQTGASRLIKGQSA